VVQVALAMLLLIGSGLMIRTFRTLRHVPPGFTNPEEIETLRIYIPDAQVKESAEAIRMEQNIMDKIAALPGVQSVGLSTTVPMDGNGWHDPIFAGDHVYSESQLPPLRLYRFLSPGLLKTMGNTLVAGRDFTWTDIYGKRPVDLRESGARVVARPRQSHWPAHPREPQIALARNRRRGGRRARRWREPESPHHRVLAAHDGRFLGQQELCGAGSGDPGAQQTHRVERLRAGHRPGHLVGKSRSSAGQCAHLAHGLR
jgi:hypothetical protein